MRMAGEGTRRGAEASLHLADETKQAVMRSECWASPSLLVTDSATRVANPCQIPSLILIEANSGDILRRRFVAVRIPRPVGRDDPASYNVTLNGFCKRNAATIEIMKKTTIQCMSQNKNPTSASAYVTVMDSIGELFGSGRSTG